MSLLKVCGMRNVENINQLVNDVQPDFIGFIFHEKSPRNIIDFPIINIPKAIKKVGVFVNKDIRFLKEKIALANLDYLQLHGNETANFCKKLKQEGFKIIKAFNISEDFDFEKLNEYQAYCDYFLFDAFGKKAGGNGIVFNWQLLEKYQGKTPFLLSGGINHTMVKKIKDFKHQKMAGVDVNSGFEIQPALKNIEEIKQFKNEL